MPVVLEWGAVQGVREIAGLPDAVPLEAATRCEEYATEGLLAVRSLTPDEIACPSLPPWNGIFNLPVMAPFYYLLPSLLGYLCSQFCSRNVRGGPTKAALRSHRTSLTTYRGPGIGSTRVSQLYVAN